MTHLFNTTKTLILFFLIPVVISYNNQEKITRVTQHIYFDPFLPMLNKDTLTIKIFNNDTIKSNLPITGFGYDIYRNNALFIHQPTVPALPGNTGFANAANAIKTANLVVYKIQNNIMPPSVSVHELDSIGALK